MVAQATTTLAQMIPVVVLSGTITGLAKQAVPRETAVKSFSEVSWKDAVDVFGKSDVAVARKNPNTIFHTDMGDIMYTDGRWFVR